MAKIKTPVFKIVKEKCQLVKGFFMGNYLALEELTGLDKLRKEVEKKKKKNESS